LAKKQPWKKKDGDHFISRPPAQQSPVLSPSLLNQLPHLIHHYPAPIEIHTPFLASVQRRDRVVQDTSRTFRHQNTCWAKAQTQLSLEYTSQPRHTAVKNTHLEIWHTSSVRFSKNTGKHTTPNCCHSSVCLRKMLIPMITNNHFPSYSSIWMAFSLDACRRFSLKPEDFHDVTPPSPTHFQSNHPYPGWNQSFRGDRAYHSLVYPRRRETHNIMLTTYPSSPSTQARH
jgi:hypothetical protein